VTADSAPPQLSPDGYWWWTGQEWVPAAGLVAAAAPTAAAATSAAADRPAEHTLAEPTFAHIPQQQSWDRPVQLPVFEILPASAAPAAKPGRLRAIVAASTAAVVLASAGAAFGVQHYLGGGGQQPEDVLPGNAAAVVKVDLDPSLSQKAALFRLSRAFPQLHTSGADSIKDDLLRPMFTNAAMSYDRDVKPWLGDRAAVAAVPDGSPDGFAAVAAVQYTDKAKAKRTLLAASARASTGSDPMFFAFSGDYAVIASTQADADRYAHAPTHLSDNATYKDAVASLSGDQIAVAWADLKRAYDGVPAAARRAKPFFANVKAAPSGSFVVGVHAASNYLEVQGKAIDVGSGLSQLGAGAAGRMKTANLVGALPSNTVAAFEMTGRGDAVSKAYAELPPSIQHAADGLGLKLPGDLAAILGTDTAFGLTGDLTAPTVVARVRTANPVGAVTALGRLQRTLGSQAPWCPCPGSPLTVRREAGGYVLTTDAHARTTGALGRTASFTRAVPDAKSAGLVLYVNVAGLPRELSKSVQGLDAVGLSVNGATGDFRLRLTTR
jgi:hypothetical protein